MQTISQITRCFLHKAVCAVVIHCVFKQLNEAPSNYNLNESQHAVTLGAVDQVNTSVSDCKHVLTLYTKIRKTSDVIICQDRDLKINSMV
jgi:hypothetical protein